LISLDKWQDIRARGIGKQEPIKQISRETGVAINTIRKCLRSSSPPERRGTPTRTPMMSVYESDVDALLKHEPRITAVRTAQILREKDPTFSLGERAVRSYVAGRRLLLHPKEVFIRQVYVPGDQTQYDFKDVKAIIAGEETDLHLFTARLSHSTAWFGHCYRTEDQAALFDGFLRTAVEFNGVTRDGVFDNPKTAVVKILRGRNRKVNAEFAAFTGSLAIDMQFAAPAKGNEKGGVEGAHGYVEDNFFRPMRSAGSLEELNEALLAFSRADRERQDVDGHSVAERLEFERAALKPLPAILPRPCVHEHVRINKFAEVRCRTNRYSVPTQFVGRPATVELFADRVRIIVDSELAAEWPRLYGRNESALDPLHYLGALKRKHRAVERAAVFNNERFPETLRALLKRLIGRDRDTAGKQFMRVIELLMHHRMTEVVAAVELAAEQGVDDPAAIALLLEQRSPATPQPLTLSMLPQAAQIAAPQARLDGYTIAELKEVAA
jgi:transposase